MKRSLFIVSLFAIILFPGLQLVAQLPAQDPDKCDYPIHRGKEIDRKTIILDKPEPAFTAQERREHARQRILLTALFCGSGEVVQIKVKTGVSDRLDAKAIAAAKKIRFIPGEKNGNKISQELILAYYVQNY